MSTPSLPIAFTALLALLPSHATAQVQEARSPVRENQVWGTQWSEEEVGIGVLLRQRQYENLFDSRQSVSVLEIDLDRDGVRLRFVDAGGMQLTSVLGESTASIAAVNGGYFTAEGSAVGLLKIDGNLIFPNRQARQAAIGIDDDEGIRIRPAPMGDWAEMPHALSAGPLLVVGGTVDVAPGFAHETVRHPRSALGLTPDKLLLVTVDGRSERAAGMTCAELARFMVELGCHTAVNLDGGGSTTMWVRSSPANGVVNHPSDNRRFDGGGERAVGNAVVVFATDVIVRDNDRATLTPPGAWVSTREGAGFWGQDYAMATDEDAVATWHIHVELPGTWIAMARWPRLKDATQMAIIAVGEHQLEVDQKGTGGEWLVVAELEIREPRTVEIMLTGEGGVLAADAVRLVQRR